MFTGIIEKTGTIKEVSVTGTNRTFWISSSLAPELRIDQSLSHDGVCLTVEETREGMHRVTAIAETLLKTNLAQWKAGTLINLERCMLLNGRIDGHMVQGHVDCTATCTTVAEKNGSWEFSFIFSPEFSNRIIEKGSISINGTSLTLFNAQKNSFTVAIIPYTYEHTNIHQLEPGSLVNIEFDMIGKYVERIMQNR